MGDDSRVEELERQLAAEHQMASVGRLLAMIDGAPASECRLTLPAELIVRASTIGRR